MWRTTRLNFHGAANCIANVYHYAADVPNTISSSSAAELLACAAAVVCFITHVRVISAACEKNAATSPVAYLVRNPRDLRHTASNSSLITSVRQIAAGVVPAFTSDSSHQHT